MALYENIVGMIGGSGFEDALDAELGQPLQAASAVTTEYGEANVTVYKSPDGNAIAFLPRHGAMHGIAPHLINHHANIAALQSAGCRFVLSTTAVGSLRQEFHPGDLAVPDDFLDLRGGAPTTLYNTPGNVAHTEFTEPFSRLARAVLIKAAEDAASESRLTHTIIHPRATYLCVHGPRYETPAEVRCFAAWGADLVGMTVAPEAILARESGLDYATISVVTNYGTGLSSEALSHGEVEAMMRARRAAVVSALLLASDTLARHS